MEKMNDKTFGALRRITKEAKEYRKIVNKDFPVIMGNDIELVESWIKEKEVKNEKLYLSKL